MTKIELSRRGFVAAAAAAFFVAPRASALAEGGGLGAQSEQNNVAPLDTTPLKNSLIEHFKDGPDLKLVGLINDADNAYSDFFNGQSIVDVAAACGVKHLVFQIDSKLQPALEGLLRTGDLDAFGRECENMLGVITPATVTEEFLNSWNAYAMTWGRTCLYAQSKGIAPHFMGEGFPYDDHIKKLFEFYNQKREEFAEHAGEESFYDLMSPWREIAMDRYLREHHREEYYGMMRYEQYFAEGIVRANERVARRIYKLDGSVMAMVDQTFIGAACSTTSLIGDRKSAIIFGDQAHRERHYDRFLTPDFEMWDMRLMAQPADAEIAFDTGIRYEPQKALYAARGQLMERRGFAQCNS